MQYPARIPAFLKKIMVWNKYGMQYSRPAKSKVATELLR